MVPVNLTLEPALKRQAKAFAFENNESLSELVTRLLESEVARPPPPAASGDIDQLAAMVREMEDEVRPIVARIKGAGKPQSSNDDKKHKAAKH
jgi:hypothetical protein